MVDNNTIIAIDVKYSDIIQQDRYKLLHRQVFPIIPS